MYCMGVRMDEQCPCTEREHSGHYIGAYEYCKNCPHTLAAHQMSPAERNSLPKPVAPKVVVETEAKVSEPVRNDSVVSEGTLSVKEARAILQPLGLAGERGRLSPEQMAKAAELSGKSAPVVSAASVAPKPVRVIAPSTDLPVSVLRARLVKIGKAGQRGRLSPSQIALALTLED